MSSERPDKALVDEIDALVERLKALHDEQGRKVAKKLKRTRKGREPIAALAELGLPPPEDLRAFYWNWNGAFGGMTMWEETVFLNFAWSQARIVHDGARIAQIEEGFYAQQGINLSLSTRGEMMTIFPDRAGEAGTGPLEITQPWSATTYPAFDGIVAMLRSVVAAQEAGLVTYAPERVDGPDGTIEVEKGEPVFDPAALWQVIAPLNPRTAAGGAYWPALAAGEIAFDGTPPDISEGITMKPEVVEIVFRDAIEQKKRWDEEFASGLRDPVTGRKIKKPDG